MSLNSLKVAELRAKALEMGLETTGTKAVLIKRIEAAGSGGGDEKPEAEHDEEEEEKPKKKAAAKKAVKKAPAPKKKKAKQEDEEDNDDEDVSAPAPKAGKKTAHETRRIQVDRGVTLAGASVFPGHGVMLNQTNIANNNNKFYVIQLLDCNGTYAVWTRWGRVGEPGQNALKQGLSLGAAKTEFAKKFKEKTKNVWSDTIRDSFKSQPGKYTLLDMAEDDDDEDGGNEPARKVSVKHVNKDSKLPANVQAFVRKIYDSATGNLKKNIDCEFTSKGIKTPLGVLSLTQVERGDAVLDEIQAVLEGTGKGNLEKLSNDYYTRIPHAHGRVKPPTITNKVMLKEKQELSQLMKDMLQISASGDKSAKESVLVTDDVDSKYEAMGIHIASVDKGSVEWKNILVHISDHFVHKDHANMGPKGANFDPKNAKVGPVPSKVAGLEKSIRNIFVLQRKEEADRFNHSVGNIHYLFHASRFENWVGILSRGLLQPAAVTKLGVRRTDFGWLGSGVYFGSEWSTSAGYCQPGPDGTGCMLIQKVALGKVQTQLAIDGSITGPKPGFDSIHGDPDQPGSGFQDHEYCVYKDNQAMMNYLIEFER